MIIAPTPVVELNRAVAVAEVEGPEAALTAIEHLDLDSYYLWHAVRADLHRRCGRDDDAIVEYERAIDRTDNPADRQLLRRRLGELSPTPTAVLDTVAPNARPQPHLSNLSDSVARNVRTQAGPVRP